MMGNETENRLGLGLKFAWGIGSVGTVTVLTVTSLLLLFFMTTVLGIAPALAGGLLFGAKLFDAVAAPIMGTISDNWKGRWGRRAPFLFAGGVFGALGVSLVFNPPAALVGMGLSAWLLASLVIIALGYTLFNVPYIAMPAEMTSNRLERTSIMSWRIGFVSLGGLLVGLMPQLATTLGGGRQGYGAIGLILGGTILLAMTTAGAAALRTRRVASTGAGASGFGRFAIVFKNRPFMLIMAAKVMQLIGLASMTASILFLLKSVLGTPDSSVAYYVTGSTAGTLLTIPLWARLNKRFAKQTLYMIACLGFSTMVLTWLLASRGEALPLIMARGFGVGVFTGGLLLMGQSLLPDAIDEDCRKSGVRREGVYAGAYSLVEKLASAIGPLIVGVVLQIFEFQPSLGRDIDQPADAITGIYFGASVLPALLYALSVIPLLFFRLEPVVDPAPQPAAAE
ncbi:MFS transporter [Polymorphobacter sp.]|uniref:MFS transporter n=1 Tax=Polymorphobacter sp. TaxID=1909290 RepID=UPI003F6F65C6